MKTLASRYGVLPLCFLLLFFSCTKTNEVTYSLPSSADDFTDNRLVSLSQFAPGDSLVLRGDTSMGDETAMVQTAFKDNNVNNFVSFTALAEYLSGNGGIDRSLMKFSLRGFADSGTNAASKIQKAVLYLYQYHRPADNDPYTNPQTDDNSAELHRVVSHWDANTVTWNTQPKLAKNSADSLQDVIIIPAVVTPLPRGTNDNQALDVTAMLKRMLRSGVNEGFMLKLSATGEAGFDQGRAYGSFACPIVARRPRLVIYF